MVAGDGKESGYLRVESRFVLSASCVAGACRVTSRGSFFARASCFVRTSAYEMRTLARKLIKSLVAIWAASWGCACSYRQALLVTVQQRSFFHGCTCCSSPEQLSPLSSLLFFSLPFLCSRFSFLFTRDSGAGRPAAFGTLPVPFRSRAPLCLYGCVHVGPIFSDWRRVE